MNLDDKIKLYLLKILNSKDSCIYSVMVSMVSISLDFAGSLVLKSEKGNETLSFMVC